MFQKKYKEFAKKFNKILDQSSNRLEELKKLREEMYKKNISYDSEEFQKNISETREIYLEKAENFYNLLDDIKNYFNSINRKIEEISKELIDLKNEIQFNYCYCCIEKIKIENQVTFRNTGKIDNAIKKQYQKLEEQKTEIEKQNQKLEEQKTEIEKQNSKLRKNSDKIDNHDKRILEMMGIFLSIFSVIGLGVSSILNFENNHFAIWLIICGVILITISGLFYMIGYKDEKVIDKRTAVPMIIGVLLFFIGMITVINFPMENKAMKDFENKIKMLEEKNNELEKNLNYEKRINELENKTK